MTLHQSADGLVFVAAVDSAGNVLATDSVRVNASGIVQEFYLPAHDISHAFERVDGSYVPIMSMDAGSETTPLPGGGSVTIVHQVGYDVIVTVGPDGEVVDIRIQVTGGGSVQR